MARRRRAPKAPASSATATVAPTEEPCSRVAAAADVQPSASPAVHATTLLADLPAEVLLEVAVHLPTTADVHAFVSRTCKALRQLLAGAAAAATLPARWLLYHRPATALTCAAHHGNVEVLRAVLALAAGPPDPHDLAEALRVATDAEDGGVMALLMGAGADAWVLMAHLLGDRCRWSRNKKVEVLLRAVAVEAPSELGGGAPRWTFPDGGEALRRALGVGGGGEGAQQLVTMLRDAATNGCGWAVTTLLAAGADAGQAIDAATLNDVFNDMYLFIEDKSVAEALARMGSGAVHLHAALALAAFDGRADDVRLLLSGTSGRGRRQRWGRRQGGRAGAVGRALWLASSHANALAIVRMLLEDAAAGQVGQNDLDEALCQAVLWAECDAPTEVVGLLAGAGATADDLIRLLNENELWDSEWLKVGDDVVVGLALALRAAGAGDDRMDWEALGRAARARNAVQLRALLDAGIEDLAAA